MRCDRRIPADSWLARVEKVNKLPIVEVLWWDAQSVHGWDTLPGWRKEKALAECRTVGYLVKRTKREIVMAQGIADNGKLSECWGIPAPWVTKVRLLRRGDHAK